MTKIRFLTDQPGFRGFRQKYGCFQERLALLHSQVPLIHIRRAAKNVGYVQSRVGTAC
jgi:hypothetical protein